ncbi:hypothetical protein J7E96_36060 [Streptomyces sp. ISL-96]|uniref:hypothetical protein n=1 Tax=Streptomyces sp. ISL-96 TaxID=2819191 RepID=UPI001BE83A18|nr:hypothetical protein [Streptomyces sp. ISL-96]MBT2493818.1 hypothetical protein [Streptomyces sp. ISL-96]
MFLGQGRVAGRDGDACAVAVAVGDSDLARNGRPAADRQRSVADALGDGAQDGFLRGFRVDQDEVGALLEADQNDRPALLPQLGDQREIPVESRVTPSIAPATAPAQFLNWAEPVARGPGG